MGGCGGRGGMGGGENLKYAHRPILGCEWSAPRALGKDLGLDLNPKARKP